MSTKFIFVTGGVVSGLGKGITAASLGRLLKCRGLKVSAQKLDPYMNIDPGTMNPLQHGEVFVTEDGAETDLDLGHYERFIDENLSKYSNLTSGKVYWNVLQDERAGKYQGETVQIIPHVTNEIKKFINKNADKADADVVITEIGGTIGDIEGMPFVEAIRQISLEKGKRNCLFIHVTLLPYISGSDEYKSKPTQHSVKELQSMGIAPDIIVLRSDKAPDVSIIKKIAMFCNVNEDCVISNVTLPSLYSAPIMLHDNNLDSVVCRELGLETPAPDLTEWKQMLVRMAKANRKVKIAVCGKYIKLHDAYLSIIESLYHAGYENGAKVEIEWVDSENVTAQTAPEIFKDCKGILVPGGFGPRGIEGKIAACRYARENDIPYFGICLGMQIAVIEFARNVLKLADAHSREFLPESKHTVIDLMPDQHGVQMGGTMRLGAYPCKIKPGTIMENAYSRDLIHERHRHRYEFNNAFRAAMEKAGLVVSGESPDGRIVETVELKDKKFFVGVQFHPEFKSRPNRAHPLFKAFVGAALKKD
ncbi:MAG: CTP synthase [Clostridiaceae bacterium]|jgi:CTP synthase|nr:CTP synthase [Clostridiaceae bacterium]